MTGGSEQATRDVSGAGGLLFRAGVISANGSVVQVRIQVRRDGEWVQPQYNADALVSALEAARQDMMRMRGEYGSQDLEKIRQATAGLMAQVEKNTWADPRPAMTRVYLLRGAEAHLRVAGFGVVGCDMHRPGPRLPPASDDRWLGAGSQAEYDTASALPTCRACAARLGIPAGLAGIEDEEYGGRADG